MIGAEPHLHGPLLRQWLGAIASERHALAIAAEEEALAAPEAQRLDRRLRDERTWVLDFCWPPGYDPIAED